MSVRLPACTGSIVLHHGQVKNCSTQDKQQQLYDFNVIPRLWLMYKKLNTQYCNIKFSHVELMNTHINTIELKNLKK